MQSINPKKRINKASTLKPIRPEYRLKAGDYCLKLGSNTCIMGIVNCTPDSFSQDGCLKKRQPLPASVRLAKRMVKQGAQILDIGGESSRPGAHPVSIKEEIRRTIPTIDRLAKSVDIPISIDTYKSEVARQALEHGAVIVNNICGTRPNVSLLKMVKNYRAAIVLMHMRGTPRTMQKKISYTNLIEEILKALIISIEKCLEIGIKSDRIIVDPGIGFGKTVEHNLTILNRLDKFQTLKKPVLIGTSRKSFIGHILNEEVDKRLYGSLASMGAGIMRGAHIVRVHDVQAAKQTVSVMDAVINEKA